MIQIAATERAAEPAARSTDDRSQGDQDDDHERCDQSTNPVKPARRRRCPGARGARAARGCARSPSSRNRRGRRRTESRPAEVDDGVDQHPELDDARDAAGGRRGQEQERREERRRRDRRGPESARGSDRGRTSARVPGTRKALSSSTLHLRSAASARSSVVHTVRAAAGGQSRLTAIREYEPERVCNAGRERGT